jgi:hypothetical protein
MRSKSVTRPARRVFVLPLILSLVSMLVAAAAPAAVGAAGGTTCTGGAIDPGSYHSLTITGDCVVTLPHHERRWNGGVLRNPAQRKVGGSSRRRAGRSRQ